MRINSNYNQGNGDRGLSLLLDGHIISKDDSSCWVFSEIEHLNNIVSDVLASYVIEYYELLGILNWIKLNSFSISSFCFLKGDTTKHILNDEIINNLEKLVNELKLDKHIGGSTDFIIHNKIKYIKLDKVRIVIRDVERAFTKWRNHEIIKDFVIDTVRNEPTKAQSILINIDRYSGFLNRLSTLIWLSTRKEAELCGEFDSQSYWQGTITE